MLNCGCIMCDMCMNKPFVGFAGKNDGKCPVCESTVFKEQSKTKIGGMMLRYKVMARGAAAFGAPDDLLIVRVQRPKALEEWNDPHVKGEQRTREAVYEQVSTRAQPICRCVHAGTARRQDIQGNFHASVRSSCGARWLRLCRRTPRCRDA